MRKIRFRAWRKDKKEMHYNPEIGYSNPNVNTFFEYDIALYIPMQYTGLHDKNGREIYEGDIIRGDDPLDYFLKDILQVTVEWLECGAWYPFACDSDYAPYPKPERCEVIGNIYENKELLNA